VDLIRHGHSASFQHLVIQLLLLHLRQLVIQIRLIDRLSQRRICNSVGDFLAQRVLFSEVLPVLLSVYMEILMGMGRGI
jgi:hypothetical protein